jgi:hypothetical protein
MVLHLTIWGKSPVSITFLEATRESLLLWNFFLKIYGPTFKLGQISRVRKIFGALVIAQGFMEDCKGNRCGVFGFHEFQIVF